MSMDARSMSLRKKLREDAEREAAEKAALLRRVGALEREVLEHRRSLAAIAKHLGLDPKSLHDDSPSV